MMEFGKRDKQEQNRQPTPFMHEGEGDSTGVVMTNHMLLGEELSRYLGTVAGHRAGLATLGVPNSYPQLLEEEGPGRHSRIFRALDKMGASLGDLLDTIAYDLNLNPVNQEPGPEAYFYPEDELQRQEREESKAMGLKDVAGLCPLTQLRKIRELIRTTQLDLEHLETLDALTMTTAQQKHHRDAVVWCQSLLRQGVGLEKSLEVSILEDQIQTTMGRQAQVDPCSHQYLKLLLEIENLELRKVRVLEEQLSEERALISEEIAFVRRELQTLEPQTTDFREFSAKLVVLQEEFEMLSST